MVSIIGARPQFVKAAVVSRVLRAAPAVREILVHTGQHYDAKMSTIFFEELQIPAPKYNLEVGSGRHGVQTARMLEGIEEVLEREKPDWVLVYGDTNSTIAGALAAVKLHIPVAHVEAGLRSFNRAMPENRVLTDHASDLLFAPTDTAVSNLQREGIAYERIQQVGDVMYDAAIFYLDRATEVSRVLQELGLTALGFVLATVHRAENTDNEDRLQTIFSALEVISQEMIVVVPVHPRTRKMLPETTSGTLRLIDPIGYLDMLMLEKNAAVIATDSGGVQKEAFFYRVPCVTLRDETEWVELVELGWNRLAPPHDTASIVATVKAALRDGSGRDGSPYGDGHSAEKIASALMSL